MDDKKVDPAVSLLREIIGYRTTERGELAELFASDICARVQEERWDDPENRPDLWQVELHFLTEDQMRALAKWATENLVQVG